MRTILQIKGGTKKHREEINKIVLGEWKVEDEGVISEINTSMSMILNSRLKKKEQRESFSDRNSAWIYNSTQIPNSMIKLTTYKIFNVLKMIISNQYHITGSVNSIKPNVY